MPWSMHRQRHMISARTASRTPLSGGIHLFANAAGILCVSPGSLDTQVSISRQNNSKRLCDFKGVSHSLAGDTSDRENVKAKPRDEQACSVLKICQHIWTVLDSLFDPQPFVISSHNKA